jgi:hypothetical protein
LLLPPWGKWAFSAICSFHDVRATVGPKAVRASDHGLKPVKLWAKNKPFLLLSWFCQVFCHSGTNLTNTAVKIPCIYHQDLVSSDTLRCFYCKWRLWSWRDLSALRFLNTRGYAFWRTTLRNWAALEFTRLLYTPYLILVFAIILLLFSLDRSRNWSIFMTPAELMTTHLFWWAGGPMAGCRRCPGSEDLMVRSSKKYALRSSTLGPQCEPWKCPHTQRAGGQALLLSIFQPACFMQRQVEGWGSAIPWQGG